MDKLGAFDQLFYKADQYDVMSLVMGGVSILKPATSEKLDARSIANHLAARLEKIPLLRMKLRQDPLRLGSVRKIEDPDFDVWDHIFVSMLPTPGGYSELTRCIADLSAKPLDLTQLWRWTVVGGLEQGKIAVVCKLHHALADGIGAVEVLSSMYDPTPVSPETPSDKKGEIINELSRYALLGDAIAESTRRLWVKRPQFMIENTIPLLAALGGKVKEQLAASNDPEKEPVPELQSTSLNISNYSAKRAVSYRTLSLPEVKALGKHFGCTVNDIGLLLYSFAMQHYFDGIGEKIDFDLWCGVPISTRSDNSAAGGNQVTAGRVCLHNTIEDAVQRLRTINRDTEVTKKAARPEKPLVDMQEVVDLVFPATMDGILYLAGKTKLVEKVASKFTLGNAILSNVPGPTKPVYIANAMMAESIPLIPAIDVIAVSGGITSVDKAITIGFHCDGETVKDPELFVQGVELGLNKIRHAMKAVEAPRRKARVKSQRVKTAKNRVKRAATRTL